MVQVIRTHSVKRKTIDALNIGVQNYEAQNTGRKV